MWGVFCILVYACFPLLLVDPLFIGERGVLLLPSSGFVDNLLIALSTSFSPLAMSCNVLTRLQNSILSSYSPVPLPLSECIHVGSMSELVSSSWISSKSSVYLLLFLHVQKYLLLYSFTFHFLSPQLAKKIALIPL